MVMKGTTYQQCGKETDILSKSPKIRDSLAFKIYK